MRFLSVIFDIPASVKLFVRCRYRPVLCGSFFDVSNSDNNNNNFAKPIEKNQEANGTRDEDRSYSLEHYKNNNNANLK